MLQTPPSREQIACLVPCHNEAQTIGDVVTGLKNLNLDIDVIVVDNNSGDDTPNIARKLGARVVSEAKVGKGFAVRRGFLACNHDIVLMIDGDSTYSLDAIPKMIELIRGGCDMVVASRVARTSNSFPKFHSIGNLIFSKMHNVLLDSRVNDSFSGLRAFNYAFVKSYNSESRGFDIETDLNNFASIVGARVENVFAIYSERIGESKSKLRTFRDGWKILTKTLSLAWHYRPSVILFAPTIALFFVGLFLAQSAVREYFATGFVPRLPSLITGLVFMLTSLLLLFFISISSRMSQLEIEIIKVHFQQLKFAKSKF